MAVYSSPPSIPSILHQLCSVHITDEENVSKLHRHCLNILYSNAVSTFNQSEFQLCQKIQKLLVSQERQKDALRFTELYRILSTQNILHNRSAILQFLLIICEEQSSLNVPQDSFITSFDLPEAILPLRITAPSLSSSRKAFSSSDPLHYSKSVPDPLHDSTNITRRSGGTSGLGSWHSSQAPTPRGHSSSFMSSDPSQIIEGTTSRISDLSSIKGNSSNLLSRLRKENQLSEGQISEQLLVRDLMYVLQGIDGQYIKMVSSSNRSEDNGYRLSEQIASAHHPSITEHCHKLAELGWLYRRIRKYVDNKSQDSSLGLVVQSFLSALSLELTEYYRLVAVLEAQLSSGARDAKGSPLLTLRRLVIWTREPLERLKTLGVLVDGCKGLKGGALLSMLFTYAQHGDPEAKGLVKHLLNQVYKPINALLNTWMFEGQLQDQHHEFFIAADLKSSDDKLWHSKYFIRKNMLPKFISEELAKKILTVGKSINFLRQCCHDHMELFTNEEKIWYSTEEGKSTFDSMTGDPLSAIVNITYLETSKHLLQVLNTKYQFIDHLKAFRKYLLLGQGDFIKHLMDIIQDELAKPATKCYIHHMTSVLDSAIRSTNAQYDDPDVLNRLDVQLLEASHNDTGWDVFSLFYRVDGPISTVFDHDAMLKYLQVFNFLWRAKRIEFILAGMWRNQTTYCKQLRKIPEFHLALHQCQILTSALVHFISQLQYYIMFECLECSWAELLKCIKSAADLDEIITAHSEFLDVIVTRCLLDINSQPLLTQLRTLFDLIVDFQSKQKEMFRTFNSENEKRKQYDLDKQSRIEEGLWAESEDGSRLELQRREEFRAKEVTEFHSQFVVLEHSFNDTLKSFLERVSGHVEENLQFLARRLDFNRFYRGTETPSLIMGQAIYM